MHGIEDATLIFLDFLFLGLFLICLWIESRKRENEKSKMKWIVACGWFVLSELENVCVDEMWPCFQQR